MKELDEAIWAGDTNRCYDIAPCRCCCHEHTFSACPARKWNGCRGQWTDQYDGEKWFAYYASYRGMTETEFYNMEST